MRSTPTFGYSGIPMYNQTIGWNIPYVLYVNPEIPPLIWINTQSSVPANMVSLCPEQHADSIARTEAIVSTNTAIKSPKQIKLRKKVSRIFIP